MSAINPASFASPGMGLQAPSGVGPGAVGANRQSQIDRRQQQQLDPASFNDGLAEDGRAYSGAFQTSPGVSPVPFQQPFGFGYSAFSAGSRNVTGNNNGPGISQPQIDPFVAFSAPNGQGIPIPGRYSASHAVEHGQDPGDLGRQGNNNDGFMSSFQGLSLNSR